MTLWGLTNFSYPFLKINSCFDFCLCCNSKKEDTRVSLLFSNCNHSNNQDNSCLSIPRNWDLVNGSVELFQKNRLCQNMLSWKMAVFAFEIFGLKPSFLNYTMLVKNSVTEPEVLNWKLEKKCWFLNSSFWTKNYIWFPGFQTQIRKLPFSYLL